MKCNFHVGQKVVCVDGKPYSELTKGGWCPHTGGVYTIRSIFLWDEKPFLRLDEYHDTGRPNGPWGEGGWNALRFRPVVQRKTDISVFKDMLIPRQVEEVA